MKSRIVAVAVAVPVVGWSGSELLIESWRAEAQHFEAAMMASSHVVAIVIHIRVVCWVTRLATGMAVLAR